MTLLTPRKHYQKTSGMRSFSGSLVTILHPVLATYAFAEMDAGPCVLLQKYPEAFCDSHRFLSRGFVVDEICEPIMAAASGGLLGTWFGSGKGSGAAMMMEILGIMGTAVCLCFGGVLRKYHYVEESAGDAAEE